MFSGQDQGQGYPSPGINIPLPFLHYLLLLLLLFFPLLLKPLILSFRYTGILSLTYQTSDNTSATTAIITFSSSPSSFSSLLPPQHTRTVDHTSAFSMKLSFALLHHSSRYLLPSTDLSEYIFYKLKYNVDAG